MPSPTSAKTGAKRRVPRSTLIPLLLLIYLAVMAYIGWGNYAKGESSALYYFGTIGVTLVIIVILYFNLKRREALRRKRLEEYRRQDTAHPEADK